MTQPLIELKGISKSFDGKRKVLDNVDLILNQGEALAIIGPSGSGKSTILQIIAGLIAPDSGEIYIKGEQRQGLLEDYESSISIAMVFQQAALFDSLTVDENVGFILYEKSNLSRARIRELVNEKLSMVGLAGTANLYPSELSVGMRKRVSLARAIMFNPDNPKDKQEILLYDEPTAGLDPIASTVIENLIEQLHSTPGVCNTYIIVTHQHSTIRRTANKLMFLYEGKVRWQGTITEIFTTRDPLIRQFRRGSLKGPIHIVE